MRVIADAIRVSDLSIEGAGGTSIHIDRLKREKLDISGSGALKAEVAGEVGRQRIAISGAGEYLGARLVSDDASVIVSGAGRVVVNARRTLNATISGAGSVEYLGEPKVTERISGAGSVRRRGNSAAGQRSGRRVLRPRAAARRAPAVSAAPLDGIDRT